MPDLSKVRFSQGRQEEGAQLPAFGGTAPGLCKQRDYFCLPLLAYSRSIRKGLLASMALSVSVKAGRECLGS